MSLAFKVLNLNTISSAFRSGISHSRCTNQFLIPGKIFSYHGCKASLSEHIDIPLQSEAMPEVKNYQMIYRLPYIRIAAIVNHLKWYQTWLSGVAITSTVALQAADIISTSVAVPIFGIGVVGLVTVHAVGQLCNRQVGMVYLTSDNTSVKMSHLDFWGRRVDSICNVDDVIPISELPDNPKSIYVNIKRYSTKESVKLSLKYGLIEDVELFRKVFGNTPIT